MYWYACIDLFVVSFSSFLWSPEWILLADYFVTIVEIDMLISDISVCQPFSPNFFI